MRRGNRARNEQTVERWTAEKAGRLLEEWKTSGLSLARFSRERGFNNQRLRWWKDRLAPQDSGGRRQRRRRQENTAALKFATVVPSKANIGAWAIANAACVVIGADEIRIEIHDVAAVSAGWLREVVHALKQDGQR